MASKDLMRSLSKRLEPIRDQFKTRLYRWSLSILNQQVMDDSSLFWRLPNRVIRNLRQLFNDDKEELVRLLLIRGSRILSTVAHLDLPVLSEDELSPVLNRCVDPSETDVSELGMLPLSTRVPGLNRRRLRSSVEANLISRFQEKADYSEPGEWFYEARCGSWLLVPVIYASSSDFQVELEFNVGLGMGPLSLCRQLSLHRLFAIGPTIWDLSQAGEEAAMAELISEHCRFMLDSLTPLLAEVAPGISREEVVQAEAEWKEWLVEVRAARKQRKMQ
jgi:hypothetical protein